MYSKEPLLYTQHSLLAKCNVRRTDMTELSEKLNAVSNSFADICKIPDGDELKQEILVRTLLHGINEIGFLRASIMCMEKSQMRDTKAAADALEELEKIEFCGLLLKHSTQISAKIITLLLNNCEVLRVYIQDCINT